MHRVMHRGLLKKVIAVVITGIMISSMMGCSSDSNGEKSEKKTDSKDVTFAGAELTMDGIVGIPSLLFAAGNELYFVTNEWGDEETEKEDTVRLYRKEMDGDGKSEIVLPKLQENESVYDLFVTDAGEIVLLMQVYNQETEERIYSVRKLDNTGNKISEEGISDSLGNGNNEINEFILDKQGNIIIAIGEKVIVLDKNYKKDCELKGRTKIEGVALTKDGEVVCCNNSGGDNPVCIQVLDVKKKKWGKQIELDSELFQISEALISGFDGGSYDFYYKSDKGFYGYDMAGKEAVKLIDYMASNIDNGYFIIPVGEEKYISLEQGDNGKRIFVEYTRIDPDMAADRKVITLGLLYDDIQTQQMVRDFNHSRENDKYTVELVNYFDFGDPEGRMHMDILTGNAPDIMMLDFMPVDQYIAKGVLEDLTPYYEKDPEIDTDDIIDSVLETMQVDGGIYYTASDLQIYTMLATKETVGDRSGWNFEEFKEAVKEINGGSRTFFSKTKSNILSGLLQVGNILNNFVNWDTGECNFDCQDFKDFLEICNMGEDKAGYSSEDDATITSMIREGKVLLNDIVVTCMDDIQAYNIIYDGEFVSVGYPDKDRRGSFFAFSCQMGINSKSDVKDGAWEFIRTYMTKEYQGNVEYVFFGTPTRKDCYEMMCKSRMATEQYKGEFGNPISPYINIEWSDDSDIIINPATQKEVDMYTELINNTRNTIGDNKDMRKIVEEEAAAYFKGDKSLDETVQIIQKRMETYVNENR